MTCTIVVEPAGDGIQIGNLLVKNADFLAVVTSHPASSREQAVLDIIAVGSAAMRRVKTTVDVDFVDKKFAGLSRNFEQALTSFEKHATDTLAKRFSPTEAGSYTKHIGELVAAARKDFQGWTVELAKTSRELLDPERKGSAVSKLEDMTKSLVARCEGMFDADVKGSYAQRLNEQLTCLFGGQGRDGVLDNSLQHAIQPVLKELHELKEKVEGRKAADQVIAMSALKGRPFEEQVQGRLCSLAHPFGDDVLAVGSGSGGSRAGDFLVTVNGSGKRIVVEARDRKQIALPSIKNELERQRSERKAEFAIYVSSGPEMLPQHVGDFQMYEDKLITTIDHLHIAYRMARVMALSQAPKGDVDPKQLRSVLGKIIDTASSLRNVKAKASQIKKDGIHTDADCTETRLVDLVEEAENLLAEKAAA